MNRDSTLQQIAADLKLSPMSVSRALLGRGGVSDATRVRVVTAARERGYRPNSIARALVTGRTRTLGVLVSDFHSPTAAGTLAGVEEAARELGYKIQLTLHQRDEESTMDAIEEIMTHQTDGIISVSARADDIPWAAGALLHTRRPYVTAFHSANAEARADSVVSDNEQGAYLATRYLIDKGRRKIAFAGGPSDRLAARERYQGYVAAHVDAGLKPDHRWTAFDEFSVSGGLRMSNRMFSRNERPDSVFAANDEIAAGVLRGCRSKGLDIPTDIAVIGFTGGPICEATDPPLTTVVLPLREIGRVAVQRLIARVEHPDDWKPCVTRLPCNLMVRQSA